jgi:hypothetical protein
MTDEAAAGLAPGEYAAPAGRMRSVTIQVRAADAARWGALVADYRTRGLFAWRVFEAAMDALEGAGRRPDGA